MVNGLAKPWEGGSTKWMEECRLDGLNIACAQYSKKINKHQVGFNSGQCQVIVASTTLPVYLISSTVYNYKLPDDKLKYRIEIQGVP